MSDILNSDPLAWRPVKAPSLEEMHVIAEEAYRRLPDKFRALCEGLVVHVDDFPTEEVMDEMGCETEFDLGILITVVVAVNTSPSQTPVVKPA